MIINGLFLIPVLLVVIIFLLSPTLWWVDSMLELE